MSVQVLFDQLLELRLPAFLEALHAQQSNPQYAELTFEDRLALLVEHECLKRRENRIQRNIHAAAFPMQAAFEDIDFSPARKLDRRTILELGQCNWITSRHNILGSVRRAAENLILLPPLEILPPVMASLSAINAPHAYSMR